MTNVSEGSPVHHSPLYAMGACHNGGMSETEPPASFEPLTPLAFLERTVRVFPAKTAVVYGDRRWTYAEFGQRIGRLAGALLRAGVRPGDRVATIPRRSGQQTRRVARLAEIAKLMGQGV